MTPPCAARPADEAAPVASCAMGQLLGMTEWRLPPQPDEQVQGVPEYVLG